MKTLLASILLAVACIAANAQTTNLDWTLNVEVVTAGVTNKNKTSWRYDYGNKKDALKVDGWNFAWATYTNAIGTNGVPVDIGPYIKQQVNTLGENYSEQKQKADNSALAASINIILTQKSDLLSTAQKNQLIAIASLLQ